MSLAQRTCLSVSLLLFWIALPAPAQISFSRHNYPVTTPTNIATGDINKDSYPDIVTTEAGNPDTISVRFNNKNGTFAAPVNYSGVKQTGKLILADLDGDGNLDIVLASEDVTQPGIFVMYGRGDGTFEALTQISLPSPTLDVVVADFNHDHLPDFAVIPNDGTNHVDVYRNRGSRVFTHLATINSPVQPFHLAVGNFNGANGIPDIAIQGCCVPGHPGADAVYTAVNTGGGTSFTLHQVLFNVGSLGVQVADVDQDGRDDLLVAATSCNSRCANGYVVYSAPNGSAATVVKLALGTFPPVVGAGFEAVSGDFNGDGSNDVAFGIFGDGASSPDRLRIYAGDSKHSRSFSLHRDFTQGFGTGPTFMREADFNDDSKPDIVDLGFYTDEISVLLNTSKVTPACLVPSGAGVLICRPAPVSHVSSPFAVAAAAKAPSGMFVDAMRVYIDNVNKYTVGNGAKFGSMSISIQLSAAPGTHRLTVVAYLNNGRALTSSETFTIP